jgi:OOP family OmpA-OmpF porin
LSRGAAEIDPPEVGESASDSAEFETLRRVLLGAEYQELLALRDLLRNPNQHSAQLADVISEALAIRAGRDDSVARALGSTIDGALTQSIRQNPTTLADALYPVMGPAIRKSIAETLTGMLESFNRALEQSMSPRALKWRFDAWRTGKSYSEIVLLNTMVYQVEQVFLIHRETGLLLQHLQADNAIVKAPDMVSGMLTAIQDFISDSFTTSEEDRLSTLRLGELNVLLEQGPGAVLAVAVRGNVSADYRELMSEVLEACHTQYSVEFAQFNGDAELMVKLPQLLAPCLASQSQVEKPRSFPWRATLALAALALGLSFWSYTRQQQQQAWANLVNSVAAEPGVLVTSARWRNGRGEISGLRDPLASDLQLLLQQHNFGEDQVNFHWQAYLALDAPILQRRIQEMLQPPAGVSIGLQGDRLVISGQSDTAWYQRLMAMPLAMLGVSALDVAGLEDIEARQQAMRVLMTSINAVTLDYSVGVAVPSPDDREKLKQLAANIVELQAMIGADGERLQIVITGHTDPLGSDEDNRILGRERAENIIAMLNALGVVTTDFRAEYVLADDRVAGAVRRSVTVNAQVIAQEEAVP